MASVQLKYYRKVASNEGIANGGLEKDGDIYELNCVNGVSNCTDEPERIEKKEKKERTRVYKIDDAAPWHLAMLSGFQHFLAMFGGTIPAPYLLFPMLCVAPDNPARADITSSLFFVCGIITIIQTFIGVRLPIIQGTTFSFLIPTYVILGSPQWKCPPMSVITGMGNLSAAMSQEEQDKLWQLRISEIQGSVMLASLFEITLGLTGLIGWLLRFITPLAITPVLTLVGLALMGDAMHYASGNWSISILTVVLIVVFSENLRNIQMPCISFDRAHGCQRTHSVPIFQLFPVLMVIIIVWILCIILTHLNVFAENDPARTDSNSDLLARASWFRLPHPIQWGYPTINVAGAVGMMGASLANIIEAVGNYYACARLTGNPSPPIHAINRGIFCEGLAALLDGLMGIGNGATSYAENVGIVGMTKMASRRVIYCAAFFMLFIGVFTKAGALFMTIPDPIIGGVFIILFSTIATVGLSSLQYVDLNSSRNLVVVGLPLFIGLAFPIWLKEHKDIIHTGNTVLDSILTVLLSTSMFLGGILGMLLDNLIPGTAEERGLIKWAELQNCGVPTDGSKSIYDFPFGMSFINKWTFCKYIPICPGYEGSCFSFRRNIKWNPNNSEKSNGHAKTEGEVDQVTFTNCHLITSESNISTPNSV